MKARLLLLSGIVVFLGIYCQEVVDIESDGPIDSDENVQIVPDQPQKNPALDQEEEKVEGVQEIAEQDSDEALPEQREPEEHESDAIVSGQEVVQSQEPSDEDKDDEVLQGFLKMPKKEDQAGAPLMQTERFT